MAYEFTTLRGIDAYPRFRNVLERLSVLDTTSQEFPVAAAEVLAVAYDDGVDVRRALRAWIQCVVGCQQWRDDVDTVLIADGHEVDYFPYLLQLQEVNIGMAGTLRFLRDPRQNQLALPIPPPPQDDDPGDREHLRLPHDRAPDRMSVDGPHVDNGPQSPTYNPEIGMPGATASQDCALQPTSMYAATTRAFQQLSTQSPALPSTSQLNTMPERDLLPHDIPHSSVVDNSGALPSGRFPTNAERVLRREYSSHRRHAGRQDIKSHRSQSRSRRSDQFRRLHPDDLIVQALDEDQLCPTDADKSALTYTIKPITRIIMGKTWYRVKESEQRFITMRMKQATVVLSRHTSYRAICEVSQAELTSDHFEELCDFI